MSYLIEIQQLLRLDLNFKTMFKPIFLPSDPVALVERIDKLMTSKAAANTGVRNELVSVCDELLRRYLIDKQKYIIIMLQL